MRNNENNDRPTQQPIQRPRARVSLVWTDSAGSLPPDTGVAASPSCDKDPGQYRQSQAHKGKRRGRRPKFRVRLIG